MTKTDQERLQSCNRMLTQRRDCKSLSLATQKSNGDSEASYAPCLYLNDAFWLYISRLSAHTRNIERTGKAGILIIEDEKGCGNAFARQRQSLQCKTHLEPVGSTQHAGILDAFTQVFGETVSVMRQLADFRLYRLELITGRYIEGFGRAFDLNGPTLSELVHVGPDNIRQEMEDDAEE